LVSLRLQPRLGSWLLALSSRAFRLCPSVWLASLMAKVVVAALPRRDGQVSENKQNNNKRERVEQ